MTTEQTNPPANSKASPVSLWGRPLAVAAAIVFFISSAFPVTAGLSKNTADFPALWGTLDVGIAFVLAILAFAIQVVAPGKVNKQAEDASYRTYRTLTHGIFVMLVVFLLFGDQIIWINGLPGLAWRTWLLLYSLPAWFTALGTTTRHSGASRAA